MNKNIDIEEVIDKYSESIRSVCRKYYLVGGNEDDLFQEGMIGFMQALQNYDESRGGVDSDSFKKFALMCAKRQILDAIKHQNAKKNQPLNNSLSIDFKNDGLDLNFSNIKLDGPEDVYIAKEQSLEKIENIKKSLSKFEKQVFELYLEGKEVRKIAEIFNKDIKSIDNTIQRIKIKAHKEVK